MSKGRVNKFNIKFQISQDDIENINIEHLIN